MRSMVALVGEEAALGFRLAGIGAGIAETPEELQRSAESLLAEPGVRLALLDETLFQQLPERVRKKLENSRSPVFIPVPASRIARGGMKPEEYVARLMRRAIGYQIKIRR